jgi:hypothetical protein
VWALRFDGWKYCEANRIDHVPLVDRAVDHDNLPTNPGELMVVLFMLQRGLFKWGLEREPRSGSCWKAFREAFVRACRLPVPEEFRIEEYYSRWEREYVPIADACIAKIAAIHAATTYEPPERRTDADSRRESTMPDQLFNVDAYRQSVAYYNANWRLLDETLSRVCRENPGHARRDAVYAKVWIIGRTYATGIERRIKTTGVQGSSMTQLAEHLIKHAPQVDEWFNALRAVTEPVDFRSLQTIGELHGRFVSLIGQITAGKSARSFASKYMHFHNAAVPIYDSVAAKVLSKMFRGKRGMQDLSDVVGADADYCWYLNRFWRLHEAIASGGLEVSVKYVDNYILWLAPAPQADAGV